MSSPSRPDSEPLDSRFNADMVVDGSADSLLATEITFSRLHRNVSEKELDLLQFSSSGIHSFAHDRRLCRIPDYAESITKEARLAVSWLTKAIN